MENILIITFLVIGILVFFDLFVYMKKSLKEIKFLQDQMFNIEQDISEIKQAILNEINKMK
jgi:hypothetical protein